MTEDLYNKNPAIIDTKIGINSTINWGLKTHVLTCSGWDNIIANDCSDKIKLGMLKNSIKPAKIRDRYGLLGMFFLFRIKYGIRNDGKIIPNNSK